MGGADGKGGRERGPSESVCARERVGERERERVREGERGRGKVRERV